MGIGLGIASRLGEAGANVVIVDIDEKAGNASVMELRNKGWKATFVKTDVSNGKDVQRRCYFAVATYGSLDILVNNAGIYPQAPVMEMKLETFEKILVNLKSVFLFTKATAEIMIKRNKGGKIINISSIDAIHPSSIGLAAYDASKHGVWGFTKILALELASNNIQVNAIAPGSISTPGSDTSKLTASDMETLTKKLIEKTPMKRIGEPDDIGKVVLFLASGLSSYMTGEQIVVDGGVLLS